jgi:hypothetical protein
VEIQHMIILRTNIGNLEKMTGPKIFNASDITQPVYYYYYYYYYIITIILTIQ